MAHRGACTPTLIAWSNTLSAPICLQKCSQPQKLRDHRLVLILLKCHLQICSPKRRWQPPSDTFNIFHGPCRLSLSPGHGKQTLIDAIVLQRFAADLGCPNHCGPNLDCSLGHETETGPWHGPLCLCQLLTSLCPSIACQSSSPLLHLTTSVTCRPFFFPTSMLHAQP